MKKWYRKVSAIVLSIAGVGMVLSSLSFDRMPSKETVSSQEETSVATSRRNLSQFAHNNAAVLAGFDAFAATLEKAYAEKKIKDIHKILEAVSFSAEKHQFETRKDGDRTLYIIHPIGVAEHLITVGKVYDPNIIIGALLHDTVEDTETTFEEIQSKFGIKVANLVREVTDDKSLPKEQRKELQIINASHKSAGATQIKLSDKWYNLNDLITNPPSDWPKTRVDQYFLWAEEVVNQLPPVNTALKESVDKLIQDYWAVREVPRISTLPSSNS